MNIVCFVLWGVVLFFVWCLHHHQNSKTRVSIKNVQIKLRSTKSYDKVHCWCEKLEHQFQVELFKYFSGTKSTFCLFIFFLLSSFPFCSCFSTVSVANSSYFQAWLFGYFRRMLAIWAIFWKNLHIFNINSVWKLYIIFSWLMNEWIN